MTVTPQEVLETLLKHTNVLLYGPPGTGKTWLMKEVADLFCERFAGGGQTTVLIDTESEARPLVERTVPVVKSEWVTFHQSYSYEDFVLGLRPDLESDRLLSLVPRPGVLLELAIFAKDGDRSGLLLIDEINRGNVSRIFGEFITLLEPEKRLGEDGNPTDSTVTVNLPYLSQTDVIRMTVDGVNGLVTRRFSLPRGLYTLASMNSVDKSIAPIDTALRRRFNVVNIPASTEGLAAEWGIDVEAPEDGIETISDVRRVALKSLDALNGGINTFLGQDFGLGQWYLKSLATDDLTVASASAELARIWEYQLLPQLEELFHGRSEQLVKVLMLKEVDDAPVVLREPSDEALDLGGRPYLIREEFDQARIVAYLESLASNVDAGDEEES